MSQKSDFFYRKPRKRLMWLAVDLDGTLAYKTWEAENPIEVIGDPIPENIAKLQEAVDMGFKIAVHTSRPWSSHHLIQAWLEEHQIPYEQIVCGKILAHRYIDDKAINAREDKWY